MAENGKVLKFGVEIAQLFDIIPTNKLWEPLCVSYFSASPSIAPENEESIGKTGITLLVWYVL